MNKLNGCILICDKSAFNFILVYEEPTKLGEIIPYLFMAISQKCDGSDTAIVILMMNYHIPILMSSIITVTYLFLSC